MSGPVFEHLFLERLGDGVARIAIDRPERMNAVTARTFAELAEAARLLRSDGTRALILTGSGTRAFCAGYDLAEIEGLRAATVTEFLDIEDTASGAVHAIAALPFPVIAAVNGAASGGGLSIALAADIRIESESAVWNAAFVRVGFSVGELGTSWILTRLLGQGMAAELSFTGRVVDAEEALRIGLATRLVAADALQEEAELLARRIAAGGGADADAPDAGASAAPAARIGKRRLRRAGETASYASWMIDDEREERP